jgi:FtsH-binding integral membrane protein
MDNQNLENQNNNLPQAQSMKDTNKKHMTLVYAGLICWLLGTIFGEMQLDGLFFIFAIAGIVLNCMGLYKTFKYKKMTKPQNPTSETKEN